MNFSMPYDSIDFVFIMLFPLLHFTIDCSSIKPSQLPWVHRPIPPIPTSSKNLQMKILVVPLSSGIADTVAAYCFRKSHGNHIFLYFLFWCDRRVTLTW